MDAFAPRRVLLVNYEYPPIGGGGAVQARHLAEEMALRGHAIHVLTATWGNLPPSEIIRGVHIHRVPTRRREAGRSSIPEMLSFLWSALRVASRLAHAKDIEVALVYFTLPCGPIGWLLKRFSRIPYVVALMGGDVPGFDRRTLGRYHALTGGLISALWRGAAVVVANSQGLARLAQRHAPNQPIEVIAAGAAISEHTGYERSADGVVTLLFVGRLVHQKGCDILLAALMNLPGDWRLWIVGEGPERVMLESDAAGLGVGARVSFLGWQHADDIARLSRSADIFVLPSRDEGMPSAVLNAMAGGLPVIATRVGGTEEIVVDGESGLLVAKDDAAALSAALSRLIADPTLRERMGEAGRMRISRHFSWSAAATRWSDVIERALQHG